VTVRLATRETFAEVYEALKAEHPTLPVHWVRVAPDGRIIVGVAKSERAAKREIKEALKEK
jgi:hypothetical protein